MNEVASPTAAAHFVATRAVVIEVLLFVIGKCGLRKIFRVTRVAFRRRVAVFFRLLPAVATLAVCRQVRADQRKARCLVPRDLLVRRSPSMR